MILTEKSGGYTNTLLFPLLIPRAAEVAAEGHSGGIEMPAGFALPTPPSQSVIGHTRGLPGVNPWDYFFCDALSLAMSSRIERTAKSTATLMNQPAFG